MDETFDPSSAPEATRVAYYGALFAMAHADGSIDKDELQALFAVVNFEGLSDDARCTVRSYLVDPPTLADTLIPLCKAKEVLRFSLMVNLVEIAYANDVVTPEERHALAQAGRVLCITNPQIEAIEQLARKLKVVRARAVNDNAAAAAAAADAVKRVAAGLPAVLDIMRGTITGFSYDKLRHAHTWIHCPAPGSYEPVGLVEAILCHLGHLLSDVATPRGLPAPFMTLLQGINAGSIGDKGRTVGELARLMYMKGYDLRHFLVAGLTPAVVEIVLRAYLMLRHYAEHGEIPLLVASHPKYRTMLLFAHGVAVLGNSSRVALTQNPLAINAAEWYAFVRYLLPSIKYWVLDKRRLRIEHLQRINEAGWDELLRNGDALLRYAVQADDRVVELGRSAA